VHGRSGLHGRYVLKTRFEIFTAVSLALHLGVFAGAFVRIHKAAPPPPTGAGAADGKVGTGAAAVPGETFEVPELEQTADETPGGTEAAPVELDGPTAPPSATGDNAAPAPKAARTSRGGSPHAAGGAPSEPPPLYGAVGDRIAGDLVTTFKRVFPSAASTDPQWDHVPIGFYADGDVSFYLAGDGTLTHATISAAAAPAFRSAVLRTTQLLKHRLFTAHGAVTHVHMVVRVSDRLTNHGAFTIDAAGSFELPSGRHVSVTTVER
jgi:hypothetical protein